MISKMYVMLNGSSTLSLGLNCNERVKYSAFERQSAKQAVEGWFPLAILQ